MDWTKGFSAVYYITVVDKNTWRDVKRIEITGGSIKRSSGELRQSADIDVVEYDEVGEPIIRVWLDAKQGGESSHTPLFTGLATSPGRNLNGRLVRRSLQCYSILKPAEDILLPRGWYLPASINVVSQIEKLLKVTNAPINVVGDTTNLTLSTPVIAEQNETNLSMVELLLSAINWRMIVDGYGRITLCPYSYDPKITLDAREIDIVKPELTDEYDWYECPNVLRVISDYESIEYKDEDPSSRFSIQNRGREIWAEEADPYLNENETLAEYAVRRLRELQQVGRTVTYDRRYVPDLSVTDVIRLNYPAQDIVGLFMITEQTISLTFGAETSEEVMQI